MNSSKMSKPGNSSYFCCFHFFREKYLRHRNYQICWKLAFLIILKMNNKIFIFRNIVLCQKNLISFKDIWWWFVFCSIDLMNQNRFNEKTTLWAYSLARSAYRNWTVIHSSIEASCISLSHSGASSDYQTAIIVCDWL